MTDRMKPILGVIGVNLFIWYVLMFSAGDWLMELGFPTLYRCDVKNLVTSGVGVNDGFKDAWLDR